MHKMHGKTHKKVHNCLLMYKMHGKTHKKVHNCLLMYKCTEKHI
jgi:hypothetical protein